MSIAAMVWAFEQKIPDAQTKLILLALCDHANGDGICWPSQEGLADKASCSVDTVQRHLQQLVDLGFLRCRRRPRRTTIYMLSLGKKRMKPQIAVSDHKMLKPQTQDVEAALLRYKPSIDSKPSIEEDSNAPTARASPLRAELFEDAEPVDEPPKAKLFRKGKTALVSLGLSEQRSGAVIGQWLKQRYDPIGILAAIDYAQKQCAISPVAYVTQILKGSGNGKANFDDQIRELADRARELEGAKGPGG